MFQVGTFDSYEEWLQPACLYEDIGKETTGLKQVSQFHCFCFGN